MNLLKLPGPASHIDRMQQIKIMTGSAAARVCRNSAEPAVKPELPEPVSQSGLCGKVMDTVMRIRRLFQQL